ncbi:DUF3099 domain-containing protein [Humidisolicoccus flavus]|uniref:DUF3099 domain-containing protein n=1 Tax=Humidisolicoccus flavus TaxID=3111414 RepID=UPI0032494C7D
MSEYGTHEFNHRPPPSPAESSNRRLKIYFWLMGIRLVCILSCFVLPGWWMLLGALGAVFIPYFAVIIANATSPLGMRSERQAPLTLPAGRSED